MKTIKKQLCRAFTIVELVVVIAVIAALAAILIPTFVNVINSANESSDISLVKNLNTILTSEEILNGSEPATMGEALEWVESNGYKVENLTPTSSGDILWDQNSNSFLLVDSDNVVVYADSSSDYEEGDTFTADYTYWCVINSSSQYSAVSGKNYSLYINTKLDEVVAYGGVEYAEGIESTNTVVNANTTGSSSSAGGKTAVSSVKKKTSASGTVSDVIIKTNGGDLSVSVTGEGEARHYGDVNTVAVEKGSYIVNAEVETLEIAADGISLNIPENSAVSSLYVSATSISTVNITVTATYVIIAGAATSDMVTALKTKVASYANITVKETSGNATGILYFDGGDGTETTPYYISSLNDLEGLRTLIYEEKTLGAYFQLTADINLGSTWVPLGNIEFEVTTPGSATVYSDSSDIFYGIFDGNDKTITIENSTTMKTGSDYSLFSCVSTGAVIKNLKVNMNVDNNNYYSCGAVASIISGDDENSITIENITVNGKITATHHAGGVVGWYTLGCTFKNCVNNASITTSSGSKSSGTNYYYSCIGGISAMAGAACYDGDYSRSVVFENCSNTGALTHFCTDTGSADYYSIIGSITAQLADNTSGANKGSLTFTNCTGSGTISGIGKTVDGVETYYFTTDSSNTTQWLIGYCVALTPTITTTSE